MRADRLRQQRGDDRRIDPARQPADHPVAADAAADGLDRLAGEIAQLPRAGAAAGRLEEVAEDLRPLRRVRHLGMKLQTVKRQPPVLHRRHRAGVGGGQRHEIGRRLRHLIAVAHPHVDLAGHAGEQFVGLRDAASRPAVLARRRPLDRAAQRLAGQVQAVADAQHRQAEAEDVRVALRRPRLVHARRPAGENQPLGGQLANPLGRDVVSHDFAVDVLLPHPPRDQLGILRPEIEHQHLFVGKPLHYQPSGGNPEL